MGPGRATGEKGRGMEIRMGKGIEGLGQAYFILFTAVLIVLALLLMMCLVRAIRGPRIADRVVSVNMMGTMVIVMIAILAIMLDEGYLVDICIIYAMISFLAVIVLTKVYMGVYLEKKEEEADKASRQLEGFGKVYVAGVTEEEAKAGMEPVPEAAGTAESGGGPGSWVIADGAEQDSVPGL